MFGLLLLQMSLNGTAKAASPHPPSLPHHCCAQADPSLPERNASLLAEFESAPWLLPPHTPALPYAGVHEPHALLQLRATPQGRYNKTVALLTFNQRFARLAQNTSKLF